MSRKNTQKLDQILALTQSINDKVDKQNERIDELWAEVHATKKMVDEMSRKTRRDSLISGGIGGGIVAIGFELMRMKLGG